MHDLLIVEFDTDRSYAITWKRSSIWEELWDGLDYWIDLILFYDAIDILTVTTVRAGYQRPFSLQHRKLIIVLA